MKEKAEVVVIGGGITGCSTALELARKGVSVVVLEKGVVGREASGRNGGGVRQQNRNPAELPLAMAAIDIWANMEQELMWDVEYRSDGNLRLLRTEKELDSYRQDVQRQKSIGLDVCLLSPEEARERLPALSKDIPLFGATFCETDGTANPLLVTQAIARTARRLGARIREKETVTGLETAAGKVTTAVTSQGEYRGEVFLNAAGPWSNSLCGLIGLDFPATVKRAQILVTEPLPPVIRGFVSADVGYLRQALNGGIHLGIRSAPVADFDKSLALEAFREAGTGYPELFPFLKGVRILRGWAGLTYWTPDSIPILDRAEAFPNFFLAAGFSGHGFCLGPAVGRMMAEWISEGKPSLDLAPFAWSRFKTARNTKGENG